MLKIFGQGHIQVFFEGWAIWVGKKTLATEMTRPNCLSETNQKKRNKKHFQVRDILQKCMQDKTNLRESSVTQPDN